MNARVAAIYPAGAADHGVSECTMRPGIGLEGGEPPRKAGRELSLLAGELLPGLRELGGLCSARFHADIITEKLDYSALTQGDRLRLGEAEITVTAVGKRCFDECPIRQRGERCPLPYNCAFARVEREGGAAVGDGITPVAEKSNA